MTAKSRSVCRIICERKGARGVSVDGGLHWGNLGCVVGKQFREGVC